MPKPKYSIKQLQALQKKVDDWVEEYVEFEDMRLRYEDELNQAARDIVTINNKYINLSQRATPDFAALAFRMYNEICHLKLDISNHFHEIRYYAMLCDEAADQIREREEEMRWNSDKSFRDAWKPSGYAYKDTQPFQRNPEDRQWADEYRFYTDAQRKHEIRAWLELHEAYLIAAFEDHFDGYSQEYSWVFEENGQGDWWEHTRQRSRADNPWNANRQSRYAPFAASFTTRDGRSVDPSHVSKMPFGKKEPRHPTASSRERVRPWERKRSSERPQSYRDEWPKPGEGPDAGEKRERDDPPRPKASKLGTYASAVSVHDITRPIAAAWQVECARVLAEHVKPSFPELPPYTCGESACRMKAAARANRQCCEHGIQRLFRLVVGIKSFKVERLRWHPDRWAAATDMSKVAKYQAKAQEVFVALNVLVQASAK